MSVELRGPQGYDYQYLQTIFLALLKWGSDGLELIVEQKDGEDAELRFTYEGTTVTIETQVKSQQGTLGMDSLVTWVGHFPDGKTANNLLQRLRSDPRRFVLFITRSRCSDDTQTFLTSTGTFREHAQPPLQGLLADTFLAAYSQAFERSKPTSLSRLRDAYCKQQARQLSADKAELRRLSSRIHIWERTDAASVEAEVIRLLKLQHHIPEPAAPIVIAELEKAVRAARDDRKDVIPLMRAILDGHAGTRVFSRPVHVNRQDIESVLLQDLDNHHALLLTGISFCGKSHMAEWIAERLRTEQGFTCLKENQLDAAHRYLTAATSESRLCFLEDPFGHTNLEQNAANEWARLYALIQQLGPHRKLIVTSRKDLLQLLSGSPSPEAWNIASCSWRDLTVADSAYAIEVWSSYSHFQQLPDSVRELVSAGMAGEPAAVLQPGQIRHLAFTDKSGLVAKSFDELSSLAKFDAVQLGQAFRGRQPTELMLLITMALGSRVGFGIDERELFGLLQAVYEELNLPGGMTSARAFCEELERAGYIVYSDDRWMFAHPTYYEAAMVAVEKQGRFGQRNLLAAIRRIFDCGTVGAKLSCMRSFGRIYASYTEQDIRMEVRRLALLSLSGPYPTLRDEALVLLTMRIEELPAGEVEAVMKYIERYRFWDSDFEWQDGIPKFKERSDYTYSGNTSDTEELTEGQFHEIADRLLSPDNASSVLPEDVWRLARAVDRYEVDAGDKPLLLRQLLAHKEAIIREAAAFSLLKDYGDVPEHVDLVLGDRHPFVVVQGIQGCFQGWNSWSRDTQQQVRSKLQNVLTVKVNGVAAHDFMTKFSQKPYRFRPDWEAMTAPQQEELIRLWGTLLPVFLEHAPVEFFNIDEIYLYVSASEAGSFFTEDQVVRITETWIGWMERTIRNKHLGDYGMGFLDFLLEHSTGSVPYRDELAGRLLSHRDSYVAAMSLAEYVSNWPLLHAQEQAQVLAVLRSPRSDARWLRAIALTRNETPPEIYGLLLGDPSIMALPLHVTELIAMADPGLLKDAIEVYGGGYGELYNLAGRCRDYRWPCVVLEVLKHPEHYAFAAALSYAVEHVVSTFADDYFKERVLQTCEALCMSGPKTAVALMIDHVLRHTVDVNGADSRALWELIYAHLDDAEKAQIALRLSQLIEPISLNRNDPSDLLGARVYIDLLNHHLPSDRTIFLLAQQKGFNLPGIAAYLDQLFEESPPRVHLSYQIVQSQLRRNTDRETADLLAKVEELRRRLVDIGFDKKEALDRKKPPEGWVVLWQERQH